jgi:hypothetical protein
VWHDSGGASSLLFDGRIVDRDIGGVLVACIWVQQYLRRGGNRQSKQFMYSYIIIVVTVPAIIIQS